MRLRLTIIIGLFCLIGCSPEQTSVLISSTPVGAVVVLDGAEIGATPMTVQINKPMELTIRHAGYLEQQLRLTPKSDPNQIVHLEELPPAEKAATVEKAAAPVAAKTQTINNLKRQYRSGQISKSEYQQAVQQLKYKLKADLTNLKDRYRKGALSKDDYRQQTAKIKYRYEGE